MNKISESRFIVHNHLRILDLTSFFLFRKRKRNLNFRPLAGDASIRQIRRIAEIMANAFDNVFDAEAAAADSTAANARHNVFDVVRTHAHTVVLDEQVNVVFRCHES